MIKMMLQQMTAVEASASALASQVAAMRETLKLLDLQQPAEEAAKPGCPNCGSPKFSDLSGMGKIERQCLDCRSVYEPAN